MKEITVLIVATTPSLNNKGILKCMVLIKCKFYLSFVPVDIKFRKHHTRTVDNKRGLTDKSLNLSSYIQEKVDLSGCSQCAS